MSEFSEVIAAIQSASNKEMLKDLLYGITTEKERQELTQRLEIIKRLLNHEPQHKIANDLGVGVATVSRGAKELSLGRFKCLGNDK
jgi:TrpR family trp operon transcriptional repressor